MTRRVLNYFHVSTLLLVVAFLAIFSARFFIGKEQGGFKEQLVQNPSRYILKVSKQVNKGVAYYLAAVNRQDSKLLRRSVSVLRSSRGFLSNEFYSRFRTERDRLDALIDEIAQSIGQAGLRPDGETTARILLLANRIDRKVTRLEQDEWELTMAGYAVEKENSRAIADNLKVQNSLLNILFFLFVGVFLFMSLFLKRLVEMQRQLEAQQASLRQSEHRLEQRVRERTLELEVINKELESFSYSVSHDLRAPLRSIDGFSQALLEDYEGALDETGRDYLMRVRRASQRMGALIDDLLMLSRLTRREMRVEPVDLGDLAHQVVEQLRQEQPERVVELHIEQGMRAEADATLMRVLFDNLLGNAWKYSANEPLARIEVGRRREPEGEVYFVRDNGVGFDMAYADKLFGAFQRLHKSSEFEGTGIGLATVARIVHRHGGRIWAEGAVGEGATFYFTLG